jgi:hypothetical protein
MNHERAMNRLTDILRNAQTTCTDTECFTGPCKDWNKNFISKFIFRCLVPGLQNPGGQTGMTNMYLMLAIWFAIALLLFLFRPRTVRNNRDNLGKPANQVRMKIILIFTIFISSRVHVVMVKILPDRKFSRLINK